MARSDPGPAERRILILEDDFFIALRLEHLVRAQGYTVVGPVMLVDRALRHARHGALDGALLGANLRGRAVTPVAIALRARGIPFVLITSRGRPAPREPALRGAPRVEKAAIGTALPRVTAQVFGGLRARI